MRYYIISVIVMLTIGYFGWKLKIHFNYNMQEKELVKRTIVEQVKQECLK